MGIERDGVWGSFRGRFIATALLLGAVLFVVALYSLHLVRQAGDRGLASVAQSQDLRSALDALVWHLERTEASLYLRVIDPQALEPGTDLLAEFARLGVLADELARRAAAAGLTQVEERAGALAGSFGASKTLVARLLRIIDEPEARYPGLPVVRQELYPTSQEFLKALTTAIIDVEIGGDRPPGLRQALLDLRHAWTQQIMETRLFFANRFGVYGAPEASMALNLHDRALYVEQVTNLLGRLDRWRREDVLGFEYADALERMQAAAARYEEAFTRGAAIYRSPGWREDLPFIRANIEPMLVSAWRDLQWMGEAADQALARSLGGAVNAARFVNQSLWMVVGAAYLLLLAGYAMFERTIRRPLKRLASALQAEGRGERPRPLSMAAVQEVFTLNAAFAGMRSQIRARQARLESILTHARDGIITFDAAGRIGSFNKAAEGLFGYDAEEVLGEPISRLVPELGGERPASADNAGDRASDRDPEPAFRAVRRDGSGFYISLKLSEMELDGSRLYTAMVADVTERRELLGRLHRMATYDALTGLYNRRFFMDELGRVLDRAARDTTEFTLLYIDLDNFKYVNDTLGHLAGDRVLREVAVLLRKRTRSGDVLARLGGDEFAVLLSGADEQQVADIADRFRLALAGYELRYQGRNVDVGCSIGIALLEPDVTSREDLLARADLACNTAKRGGRNRCHLFSAGDHASKASMVSEMGWARRLREALQNDKLLLASQAIVEPAHGRVICREILLRLPDEGGGSPIMPAGFLPAAERFGLAVEIDRWVIGRVFRRLREYPGESYSVNLCARSVGDPGVLKAITRGVDGGVDPRALTFEIPETAAIADLAVAADFLAALRGLGCRTALDDFGAGYSNFGYLQRLPVDCVKIDGSLVRDIHRDATRLAIVRAIVEVVKALGKCAVAEHVEEVEVLQALRALGIDYCQGFLFDQPGPLEAGTSPEAEQSAAGGAA